MQRPFPVQSPVSVPGVQEVGIRSGTASLVPVIFRVLLFSVTVSKRRGISARGKLEEVARFHAIIQEKSEKSFASKGN